MPREDQSLDSRGSKPMRNSSQLLNSVSGGPQILNSVLGGQPAHKYLESRNTKVNTTVQDSSYNFSQKEERNSEEKSGSKLDSNRHLRIRQKPFVVG
jgi:hypothetical protein